MRILLGPTECVSLLLVPNPSLLCLPHDKPISQETGVEAKNSDFIRKAGREDGILVSQNHLGVWMPVSLYRRVGEVGNKVKRPLILQIPPEWSASAKGCVNFFCPAAIHSWTGSGCLPNPRHWDLNSGRGAGFPKVGNYVYRPILLKNKSKGSQSKTDTFFPGVSTGTFVFEEHCLDPAKC